MKVSLIQPIHADYKVIRKGGVFKPAQLTMPYLAACTPPEFEIQIHDEITGKIEPNEVDGDVVGITAVTPFIKRAYELAEMFRSRGQTVVLGGPHVSALPDEAMQHADAVVVGEGDILWPKALEDWQRGDLKPMYRNIKPVPLENLPTPRWDLVDREKYIIPQVVQASRGCPFSCDFCSLRTVYPTYRTRPVRDVIAEVEKIPFKKFVFWDDNIIGNPEWAKKLFRELAHLNKQWLGQSTITIARSRELVRLAAKSGCSGLFVGLESFSDHSLKGTNKDFNNVQKYIRDVRLLREHGIGVLSGMVFGFDQDTLETFDANLEGAIAIGLAGISCSILTPFPGTPLFDRMKRRNRLTTYDWSRYTSDDVVFTPAHMTPEQLITGHNRVGRQFYNYSSVFKRYFKSNFYFHPNPWRMLTNNMIFWALNFANRRYFRHFYPGTDDPGLDYMQPGYVSQMEADTAP